ncbi:MAG: glycosyltransferase [Clostridium sp.]|nr:glycosyltransferase [Clostridium sp.]
MIKVSVIMSVYKERAEYLRLSLDSILNQTYDKFEFIIVLDNPQNQELKAILEEYKKRDNRIKILVNQNNIGLAMSLNRAAAITGGEYLARMDADDISLPERFSKQVEYLDRHTEISVLGINKYIINEGGSIISKGGWLPRTPEDTVKIQKCLNVMPHSGIMMRKCDFDRIGGYRNFPTSQDYDLLSRFITAGLNVCNLDEYLINIRINPEGISIGKAYRQAVTAQYIRQLEKERIKTGTDSFSQNGLEKYLKKNKVDDLKKANNFQEALILLSNGRIELKEHHSLSGMKKIIKAGSKHHLIRLHIIRRIQCIFIKKRWQSKMKKGLK